MPEFHEEHIPLPTVDLAIIALLGVIILFTPLALGTVQPWSEEVFVGLTALLAGVTSLRVYLTRAGWSIRSLAIVPLIAFPLVIAIQLLPWTSLTAVISPQAVAVRQEFVVPLTADGTAASSVSLYRYETARHLRLLLGVISVFVAASCVVRNRAAVLVLLRVIMISGGLIAIIAAGHVVFGIEKIYGVIPRPPRAGETSAPFINRSHFAQYMNAAVAASLALLLAAVSEAARHYKPRTFSDWIDILRQGAIRDAGLPAVIAGVCAASVLSSASRGGVLAMCVAAILVAAAAARRRTARMIAGAFVGIVILAVVGALLVSTSLRNKVGLLTTVNADGGRWELLLSQVSIWKQFPVLGVGFGTFEYVFPRYDLHTAYSISSHAENEYAQIMTETGAAGAALMLVFLAAVWIATIRAIRYGGTRGLICTGLLYGLTAVTLHSALDFGQHLPANAVTTAVFAAIVLRLGRTEAMSQQSTSSAWFTFSVTIILTASLAAAAYSADRHRRGSTALTASQKAAELLARANWQGSQSEFDNMTADARRATKLMPSNARAQFQLGSSLFWNFMRDRSARFDEAADAAAADRVMSPFVQSIADAPLFGMPYAMAGQLYYVRGDVARADKLIAVAAELSPQDGWTLSLAGEASLRRGDYETALRHFRRATASTALSPEYIVDRLINGYNRGDLALEFARGNSTLLDELDRLLTKNGQQQLAESARQQMLDLLLVQAAKPDASAGELAFAAERLRENGKLTEAATFYRRALSLDTAAHQLRLTLARVLVELGEPAQAEAELRTALREQPDWKEARELAAQLRLQAVPAPK